MSALSVATDLWIGDRGNQEDCLASFQIDDHRYAVIVADGMGGHAAGEVASQMVVEVFSSVLAQSSAQHTTEAVLRRGLKEANGALERHVSNHPECEGMGTTVVALILEDGAMDWVSVGDSILYLFRNGRLTRLNEDHSMVPVLQALAQSGEISFEQAMTSRERNALRSVMDGGEIPLMDVSRVQLSFEKGDTLLVATDGLETISQDEVSAILTDMSHASSSEVLASVLAAIQGSDRTGRDNVALSVVKAQDVPKDSTFQRIIRRFSG